jgi:hypothetical protein
VAKEVHKKLMKPVEMIVGPIVVITNFSKAIAALLPYLNST